MKTWSGTDAPLSENKGGVCLLDETWDSVPATYDPLDPMAARHARALNAIAPILARARAADAQDGGSKK